MGAYYHEFYCNGGFCRFFAINRHIDSARAAAPAAVVLGPSNNTAAALSFNVYADTKSTVGFQVTSIGVLTAGTQYKWDYMVLG